MEKFNYKNFLANPDEIVESFKYNGLVHFKGLYDNSLCSSIIDEILAIEKDLSSSNSISLVTETIGGKTLAKYLQGLYGKAKHFSKIFNFKLLNIATALVGTSDIYYSDLEAHLRNPGGGSIPKHQDNFYFNLKLPCAVTCYVALSQQNMNNGALRYIRGSHGNVISHTGSKIPGFSSFIPDSSQEFEKLNSKKIYNPVYDIGDVTIHHPNNIHFADPNPPESNRAYALSARIFPQNQVIDEGGVERYHRLLAANRFQ